ncbi:MAG TPA: hypothetical protein VNT51_04805, partial [Miltoncostaeaceae bacterium]|nr:hypothetical protein [Miltoncostaeaceae bacterium]
PGAAQTASDPLTGLPRAEALEHLLPALAADGGARRWVGLLRLRVPHAPGAVTDVQWAAAAWRDALRGGDVLARVGPDLFAAALAASSLPVALQVLERVRAATPEACAATAGLTPWEPGENAAALSGRARAALAAAERAGGDRVAVLLPRTGSAAA